MECVRPDKEEGDWHVKRELAFVSEPSDLVFEAVSETDA